MLQPANRTIILSSSPLSVVQGDSRCNGTHSAGSEQSDTELFEAQFQELVTELTEKDLTDTVLADALNRLREVSTVCLSGERETGRLSSCVVNCLCALFEHRGM